MSHVRAVLLVLALVMSVVLPALSQKDQRPPLAAADIDAITQLVMLEDTRQFDEAVLAKLLTSAHPEVRRRAVVAVGRIVNPAGKALLVSARKDHGRRDRRDGGVRHGSAEGRRRGPVAVRVADGHEHAAGGRTRSGPGARQDPDAGGAHGAGAVSDACASSRLPPRRSSERRFSRSAGSRRATTWRRSSAGRRLPTPRCGGERRGRSSGLAIQRRYRDSSISR